MLNHLPIQKILFVLCLFALAGCSGPNSGASQPEGETVSIVPSPSASQPTTPPPTEAPTTQAVPSPTEPASTSVQTEEPTHQPEPSATTGAAVQFPDPQAFQWQVVTDELRAPIGIANAGDGSGRLFILEQPGIIRILLQDQLIPDPFLDIRDRVGSSASEQGLLGLAFHPNYTENGFFFVNYTDLNGNTVIARYSVDAADPNRADPASELRLIQVDQPYGNHNGGVVAFGPDGYLYLGLGDGGSGGDPHGNGQSLQTMLGKILRINVDEGERYSIPEGNPFADGGGLPEIWAYGLRNPWRFSFDHLTGDLYIGDVGQGSFEEINFQPADSTGGENYGWNITEGFECFRSASCDTNGLTLPVVVYPTHEAGNCSVTGGVIYRGGLPDWQGIYMFGDYCSGRIWGLLRNAQGEWEQAVLYENVAQITSFGEDEQGEVYLSDHDGAIYHLSQQ